MTLLLCIPAISAVEPADSARHTATPLPVIVSTGAAFAANATLTELLKASIHETRPDGSDRHSWPSRHTSWAFTGASVLAHELYVYSPWWGSLAHAAADAVAMQRILAKRHYPKDVLGGAAIGILSGEIGYLVRRIIFPGSQRRLPQAPADWLPGLDITTSAIFALNGPARGTSARTGAMSAIRLSLPMAEWWGPAVQLDLRSIPIYTAGHYNDMLNGLGISAGATFSWQSDSRWASHARIMPGVVRNFHTAGIQHSDWAFSLEAAGGAYCQLTPTLAIGAEGGYMMWTIHRPVNALTISLITRANF